MAIKRLQPNGTLSIPLGLLGAYKTLSVVGGPWDAFPGKHEMFGVCVRAERVEPGSYNAWLPIEDFSVPRDVALVEDTLRQALRAGIRGREVYVGCMGGWGRTGLFLSLLAKAAGVPHPVDYVRKFYAKSAVETAMQKHFVETFDVSSLRWFIAKEAWLARLFSRQ